MTGHKKVRFEDDNNLQNEDYKKNNSDKVSVLKIEYVWQYENNKFNCSNKILKTSKKNIDLPVISKVINDRELIFLPKFITINPFRNDGSILTVCDVLNNEGENITFEKRNILFDFLKNNSLNNLNPKFSFSIKILILKERSDYERNELINNFIDLLLKARININEYYYDDTHLVIENDYTSSIACADELLALKYILKLTSEMSNFEYKFHKYTYFKFMDNITINENGINAIKKYNSYFTFSTNIPESVKKMGKGYLIGEIDENKCVFEHFKLFQEKIYLLAK